jgi:hypothetical protein
MSRTRKPVIPKPLETRKTQELWQLNNSLFKCEFNANLFSNSLIVFGSFLWFPGFQSFQLQFPKYVRFPCCRVAETRKLAETSQLTCHFADVSLYAVGVPAVLYTAFKREQPRRKCESGFSSTNTVTALHARKIFARQRRRGHQLWR